MATTEEEDVPPEVVTVADHLGNVWEEVRSIPQKTVDIVYTPRRRSLWPVLVVGVALTALWLGGTVAGVVGSLAVFVLGFWVMATGD